MARGKQSASVVLSDAASANKIGLKLLRDQNGALAYTWRLQPELVWRMRNWWDGALQFYYNPQTPAMYGLANGVWAATENELSLGPRVWTLPYGVPNGGVENNSTSGFVGTGAILAVTSTPAAVAGGLYALSVTSWDTGDDVQTSSLPNPTRYASRTIRATVWARIPSGTGAATLHIDQNTGAGFSSAANSGSVTLSTTYTQLRTGTLSVAAGVTALRLRVVNDSGTSTTIQLDEFSIEDTPTLANMTFPPFHMVTVSGTQTLVHVTQNAVWAWNELAAGSEGTTGYWQLQYFAATAIRGARVWDNRLFLGHGSGTAYEYSAAGDLTTAYTASTLTDTSAFLLAMGRSAFADTYALFKTGNSTDNTDTTKVTVNPVNGGTQWGAAIETGFQDHTITGIYEAFGNVYVGKEDGLYVYATNDYDTSYSGMTNIAQGLQFTVGQSNFNRGAFHQGHFYTVINDGRLWRYDQSTWQDMSGIVDVPAFTELGGTVTSIGSDGQWLYLTVEDRAASATTKENWLLMCREHPEGWEVHTIAKVRMTNAYGWGALTNSTSRFVYVAGDHSNTQASYRVQLGTKANTPRLASLLGLQLEGTFITPYIELPEKMTINRMELISELLSANLSVAAAYETDDQTSFTNINSTDAIFNTSPAEVIAFNAGVNARRVRLQLTFDTNALTTTPVVKGINLFMARMREWQFVAEIADDQTMLQGVPNALPAEQMLARLATLRASVAGAPLNFEDLDGTARRCIIAEMEETQIASKGTRTGGVPVYTRGVRLILREAVA